MVRQFLYTVCCAHHHNIIKSQKRTNPPWTFWYAVGPVTQYRKVHRTFLPNFFASLKIWTLVFESLQPEIIKIAKQINIYFAILVRWKGLEPPTYWFVASHSIQLSYRRVRTQRAPIYYHNAPQIASTFFENREKFSAAPLVLDKPRQNPVR